MNASQIRNIAISHAAELFSHAKHWRLVSIDKSAMPASQDTWKVILTGEAVGYDGKPESEEIRMLLGPDGQVIKAKSVND